MGVYRIHDGGIWQGVSRVLRIKSELETAIGIYIVDKDTSSSNLVKNSMLNFGYLGISFIRNNIVLYAKCIYAIYSNLGIKSALGTLNKTINYFSR